MKHIYIFWILLALFLPTSELYSSTLSFNKGTFDKSYERFRPSTSSGEPVAVCESYRRVSVSNDGIAHIAADAFDDGSHNYGEPVYFKARRAHLGGCNNLNGDDSSQGGYQEWYDDYVKFCCDDIGTTVMVNLRVYSINPGHGAIAPYQYAGEWSECWSSVTVEDQLPPSITCPSDRTVSCDDVISITDLTNNNTNNPYGYAAAYDNCSVSVSVTATNPGSCGIDDRYYTRTFTATDPNGLVARCTQKIYVEDTPFTICDTQSRCEAVGSTCSAPHSRRDHVEWPCDLTLNECGLGLDPYVLDNFPSNATDMNGTRIAINAYPRHDQAGDLNGTILGQYPYGCAQIAIDSSDQVFTLVGEACLKIIRTWTVIDWCQFDAVTRDPDDPNRFLGYWDYIQIIKLKNTVGPTFDPPTQTDFCDETTTDCYVDVILAAQAHDDCSPNDQLHYTWSVDLFSDDTVDLTGSGSVFTDRVPQAYDGQQHTIRWTATDGCGNKSITEYTFTARECKKPSPYCDNGIAIVVMPSSGCISIWASDFNAGGFDNCTAEDDLIYTMRIVGSGEDLEGSITLCCEDIYDGVEGQIDLEIWVEDEAGNIDNCVTYVLLQDTPDDEMPEGICPDICIIEGFTMSEPICNDSGTPSDPIDDTYTFTVQINGVNTAALWEANDVNMTTGAYDVDVLFGPYLIRDGDITFTIADAEDAECALELTAIAPETCSDLCAIEHVATAAECDDNGTPSDPSDDTFTFNVEVNGLNIGASWSASDPNTTTGTYGTSVTFGPYPISGGDLNFEIIDTIDPMCITVVSIQAPETCSDLCAIEHVATAAECDDNGTPSDPSDDTFTFNVEVNGLNIGASWSASDPNTTTGTYGTSVTFGPYPISGGDLNFEIIDAIDPMCITVVSIQAPETCSDQCVITQEISNIVCDDNGTPGDPADDLYFFDARITGLNTAATWVANDPNNTTGGYNIDVTFGPYAISDGGLGIIITDAEDATCATTFVVNAPAPCSEACEINNMVSNIVCFDNDSPANPDDDTYTFEVVVTGVQTGPTWTANDPNNTTGTINNATVFGPYPISGGPLTITITSDANGTCQTTFNVTPPNPCSEEMLCTTIYGITSGSSLYGINTETGEITFINTANINTGTNALGINDELGLAYFASVLTIFWMDIATGVVGEVGTISIPGTLTNGAGAFSLGNLYVGTEDASTTQVLDIYRLNLAADGKSFTSAPQNISNGVIPDFRNFGDFVIEDGAEGNETIILSVRNDVTTVNNVARLDVAAQTYTILSEFPGPSTAQITRDNAGTWWLFENSNNTLSTFDINTGMTSNTVNVGFSFADLGRAWCEGNMNLSPVVAGRVRTQQNEPVTEHDIMIMRENEMVAMSPTSGTGQYGFSSSMGSSLKPYKNDDASNGISTLDLIAIQRHIVGIEYFDNPYDMIAADADNTQNINVLDLLELQRVILGLQPEFRNNTSWRYVNEDFQLSINDPFNYMEYAELENCTIYDPCVTDFVAVKIGDINGSVQTTPHPRDDIHPRGPGLNLVINNSQVENADGIIRIPVTSSNFNNIEGYQLGLAFDATQIRFDHVESGLLSISEDNVSVQYADHGLVEMVWYDAKDHSYDVTEILFTLVFRGEALGSITVSDEVIDSESYVGGHIQGIRLTIKDTEVSTALLAQNIPNPFDVQTVIPVVLAQSELVSLRIYDVNGRLLVDRTVKLSAGHNEFFIADEDLNDVYGILYYQVSSQTMLETKRMLRLKR